MDSILSDIFINKKYYNSIISSFVMAKKAYAENKTYYFLYEDKLLNKKAMYNEKKIIELIYLPYSKYNMLDDITYNYLLFYNNSLFYANIYDAIKMSFDYRNANKEYMYLVKLPNNLYVDIPQREKYYSGAQLIDIYNTPLKYATYYNNLYRENINIYNRKTDYIDNTGTRIDNLQNEITDFQEQIDALKRNEKLIKSDINSIKMNEQYLQNQINVIKNDILDDLIRKVNLLIGFKSTLTGEV